MILTTSYIEFVRGEKLHIYFEWGLVSMGHIIVGP